MGESYGGEVFKGYCSNCMFTTTRPVCLDPGCEPDRRHGHCASCGYPLEKARPQEIPSRRPELGPSPTDGDAFFRKLDEGARKFYGTGGGGASGEQGKAD